MSRRVQVEEEPDSDGFDDDTDLPLPGARPSLPNTGTRGALLEEIQIESERTLPPEATSRIPPRQAPRAPLQQHQQQQPSGSGLMDPNHPMFQQFMAANRAAGGGRQAQTVDPTSPAAMEKYKRWICIYPIYIDAKRAYGTGQRRIAREKSVWWPRSDDITTAAASLQLPVLHEADKAHPRDWENPGRIKVQWKQDDGRLTNPAIPTKKKLFELIAAHIQRNKPSLVPDMAALLSLKEDAAESVPPPAPPPVTTKATKAAATAKGKGAATTTPRPRPRGRPPLPKPPMPLPPLSDRYTYLSPLVSTGALLEGWKVGTADKAAEGAAAGGPATAGKGKRKVIKIRQ